MQKIENFNLLYIEDDSFARESLAKFFDILFTNVDVCADGLEALEKFNKKNYDLIISDIDMPNMDGIEFISHVRKTDKNIPVIFTTARSEANELINAIELNVNHYLLKPIDLQLLQDKIKSIVDNKFLNEKLKEKEKELKTIFNTTKDAIAIIDKNANFLKINNTFEQLSGYNFEELKEKKSYDFFVGASSDTTNKLLQKVLDNGSYQNIEKTFVSKENKEYFVITSYTLMPNRSSIIMSIRDITEMKNYTNLIDKHIISAKINLDGRIDYASKALCSKTFYDLDELVGQDYFLLVKQENPSKIFNEIFISVSKGLTWDGEIKVKTKKDDYIWLDTKISPTLDINKSITGYTIICQDITDKLLIKEISITDSLTGVYNRRHFDDVFPRFIRSSKRDNLLVTLIILDVDYFKQFNDTYGHQKGDHVLIRIAQEIHNSLKRADDMCFRLGGEEFGILLKSDSLDKSIFMANKIRENIENLKIEHKGSKVSDYVTISLGLVCQYAENITYSDIFYKTADDLLYKSKRDGRNRLSY